MFMFFSHFKELLLVIWQSAAEHFLEQGLDLVLLVEIGTGEDVFEFALVEPEAVGEAAAVYQDWAILGADEDFFHFFEANGASAGVFGGRWAGCKGSEDGACLCGIAEQEVEFAGVEPDSGTIEAVVNFDVVEFECDHRVFADGAVHNMSLKSKVDVNNNVFSVRR